MSELQEKKKWIFPEVITYGDVRIITGGNPKLKDGGGGDDFGECLTTVS
jgi:hypothetical protein